LSSKSDKKVLAYLR